MTARQILVDDFSKSYWEELKQDEIIWTSLPFFVGAITLSAAILSAVATKLPRFELSLIVVYLYILLVLSTIFLLTSFGYLWYGVHTGVYRQPPFQTETWKYAQELKDFYTAQGLSSDIVEASLLADVSDFLSQEYANAVSANRETNRIRFQARSNAVRFLMIGIGVAILLTISTFIMDKMPLEHQAPSGRKGTSPVSQPTNTGNGPGRSPQTGGPLISSPSGEPAARDGRPTAPPSRFVVEGARIPFVANINCTGTVQSGR